jgi:hypothetical protein
MVQSIVVIEVEVFSQSSVVILALRQVTHFIEQIRLVLQRRRSRRPQVLGPNRTRLQLGVDEDPPIRPSGVSRV